MTNPTDLEALADHQKRALQIMKLANELADEVTALRSAARPAVEREAIARLIGGVAFRPRHISGEGLSETNKEKYLRDRNVAYYKADAILALLATSGTRETKTTDVLASFIGADQATIARASDPPQADAVDWEFDLKETLKAVLYHFGTDGAALITGHVLEARKTAALTVQPPAEPVASLPRSERNT